MKLVMLDGFLVNHDEIGMDLGPEHEQVWYPATEQSQVVERIGDADGVVSNRKALNEAVFRQCPNLKYIGVLGTGYDMINLEDARRFGITVTYVPGYSTPAIAQCTFALLLDIMSRTSVLHDMVKNGQWAKGFARKVTAVPIHEVQGQTLGVYGMGDIGSAVAKIGDAFGMRVLAYRRTPPKLAEPYATYVDADTLLRESDVVSIHCPLTSETEGLFNRDTIAKMKDGAVLINTARGKILNEQDVAEALDSGKLRMLGADAISQEPPGPDHPLAFHPKAVVTPHAAWLARETRARLLEMVAENFLAYVAGKPINVLQA